MSQPHPNARRVHELFQSFRNGDVAAISELLADDVVWHFPGREGRILACPDFYLTADSVNMALRQLDRALEVGGMIDLWAHTEEVVTPRQVAALQPVDARSLQAGLLGANEAGLYKPP